MSTANLTDYFNHPYLNASTLKTVWKHKDNPRQAIKSVREGFTPTKDTIFGSALHDFILMGFDYFKNNWFVYDEGKRPFPDKDFRTKENKLWKDNILTKVNPNRLITLEEFEKIKEWYVGIVDHPSYPLLKGCEFEKELYDEGRKRKSKLDVLNREKAYVLDLKKTKAPDTQGFHYECLNFGYYLQAAFYTDICKQLFNKEFKFLFAAIGEDGCNFMLVSEEKMEIGREQMKESLEIWEKFHNLPIQDIPGFEYNSPENKGIQIL